MRLPRRARPRRRASASRSSPRTRPRSPRRSSRCAKAGLVAMPLNWRLAVPEQARILADGAPAVLIHNRAFAGGRQPSYSGATTSSTGSSSPPARAPPTRSSSPAGRRSTPRWSARDWWRRPVLHPLHGRHHRHLEGRRSTSPCDLLLAAMVNQAVAERIVDDDVYLLLGQMFHIPVVLAMNDLAHGRPVVLMNFEPSPDAGSDRGRARERLPRDHDDAQLHDGRRGLRPPTTSPRCA